MLPPSRRGRKPLRLIPVPLPDSHPDWLELDRQLPQDHLARRIRALVEQLDLACLFDSLAGVGSRAHPPDLLLQLALFEVQRKHLSPADWFLHSRESVPARWLLRGLRPARCVLYRFRDRLPQELLDVLNTQVLRLAQDEGHTPAAHAALDGTFHAAHGSRHQLVNAKTLDQRCEQLDAVLALEQGCGVDASAPASPPPASLAASGPLPPTGTDLVGPTSNPGLPAATAAVACSQSPPPAAVSNPAAVAGTAAWAVPAPQPGWMARSRKGRQRQRRRYEQARQTLRSRLADHERKQRRQRKAKRRPPERVKICPSEPEAVLGKDKCKVFRPLYNTQILQDVDSPFVLGYGVYASVTDAGLLPPLLERAKALTGRELDELLADGIYGRLLDARYCQEHGVQLYAPVAATSSPEQGPDQDPSKDKPKGKDKEKLLGKEAFAWQEQEQTYRCPQGHLLQLERRCREERRDGQEVMVAQYRCAAEHCQACPLASRCTTRPDKGRTVKRMEGQELLDALGQRMQTAEGRQRYKKRCQTVELRHADFRAHRGLQRFPSYGLRRARGLIGLLVLAHNGLALLDARDARKAKLQEANSLP
jgi:Transposase DDE domain